MKKEEPVSDADIQADWVVKEFAEQEIAHYERAVHKADCNRCRREVMTMYLESDALDRVNWANHNGRWALTAATRKQRDE